MGDLVMFVGLRVDAMLDDLGRVPRFQSLLWYAFSRTYLHSRNTAVAGRYMECAIARSHVGRGSGVALPSVSRKTLEQSILRASSFDVIVDGSGRSATILVPVTPRYCVYFIIAIGDIMVG